MKLKVRKADIEQGERCSLDKCPVGLAATRSFTGKEIRVGYGFISVADSDSYQLYALPKFVTEFLHKFEDGEKVEAFECEITKVDRRNRG